jgi:hypothetical protein
MDKQCETKSSVHNECKLFYHFLQHEIFAHKLLRLLWLEKKKSC